MLTSHALVQLIMVNMSVSKRSGVSTRAVLLVQVPTQGICFIVHGTGDIVQVPHSSSSIEVQPVLTIVLNNS